MTTIDWRGEICKLLNLAYDTSNLDLFAALQEASERLEEVEGLRALALAQSGPPRYEVIHVVRCERSDTTTYFDEPVIVENGPYPAHLRGGKVMRNLDLFLERSKAVFLVWRHYECCGSDPFPANYGRSDDNMELKAADLQSAEHVTHMSSKLRSAFIDISKIALMDSPHPDFEKSRYGSEDIRHPYLWWFHRRDQIEAMAYGLDRDSRAHFDVFRRYLRDCLGKEWATADEFMARGVITPQLIEYIFVRIHLRYHRTGGLLQRFL
jgi:hypothetical protein